MRAPSRSVGAPCPGWVWGPCGCPVGGSSASPPIPRRVCAPDDTVLVSKLGGARRANGDWYAAPTRDELRAGADRECDLLGLDHLPVVHLRWMESGAGVSFEEMLTSLLE